jgi:hypothetical protein
MKARYKMLDQFPEKTHKWLIDDKMGQLFWKNFLWPKGTHLSILGYPGAGKTQKAIWLLNYLKWIETIVWFDSCKDEEIGPLFLRGKKIVIISPLGGSVNISGFDDSQIIRKYAATPKDFWRLIEPDCINIFSIRNFFYSETERSKYYGKLFHELSRMAYNNEFRKAEIPRLSIFLDEAQSIVPSQSMTKDKERIKAGILVTSNILEVRASGIRIVTSTQDPMMLLPAARKNLPVRLLCGGARIKSDESTLLFRLCKYAEYYQVSEGLLVYPNGEYFPFDGPWKFPLFEKPSGIRIEYTGQLDREEIEGEGEKGYA